MDNSELIGKFSNIYIMLLYSIMTLDIERVKCYLSNELYIKYKNIIDNYKSNNKIEYFDELNVYKIEIIDKNIINNKEIVKVKLISRYINYIIDKNTNKIIKGQNKHRIENNNYLIFEKILDNSNIKIIHTCPNCGANLDINYSGVCNYCNQSMNLNNDYVLTDIQTN